MTEIPAELPPYLAIPLAVALTLGTIAGLWAGARKMLTEARALKGPPATPYEAIAARVTALEAADEAKTKRIDALHASVRRLAGVLTREVASLLAWVESGAVPPPPQREIGIIQQLIRDLDHPQED